MDLPERFRRIPWWVWAPLFAPVVVALTIVVGWFPVLATLIGWMIVRLVHEQPPSLTKPNLTEVIRQPPEAVELVVAKASNDQLGELWTQSSEALRRVSLPATVGAYVRLRQMLLDEMENRDAEAVVRWLADRPDRLDPRTFLEQR